MASSDGIGDGSNDRFAARRGRELDEVADAHNIVAGAERVKVVRDVWHERDDAMRVIGNRHRAGQPRP